MRNVWGLALLVSLGCAAGAPHEERTLAQAAASASSPASGSSASAQLAAASSTGLPTASAAASSAATPVVARTFSAPAWPPSDQDFALIVVPLKDEGGRACMISREIIANVPRANVEVTYAQDGRLTRREEWEFSWATRTATLRSRRRFSWAEDWVVSYEDAFLLSPHERVSDTTVTYDNQGLPARIDREPRPGGAWQPGLTHTLKWKGQRLRAKPKLGLPPRLTHEGLPVWLPFNGTVEVITTEGSNERDRKTISFNAQGFRSSGGWTSSASAPLLPPPPTTWRWVGKQMVESNSGKKMLGDIELPEVRETHSYDAEGRPTSYRHFQSNINGGRVHGHEQRYEYRCPGEFTEDPLWGP
jgi:hypothetical protein